MLIRTLTDLGLYARDRRRRALHMTQGALGERIGTSRKWVVDFEAGRTGSDLALVLKALGALGISLHALAPGNELPSPTTDRIGNHHELDDVDIDEIVDGKRHG